VLLFKLEVKVNLGIFKIVGCRKKNVGVQEEEAIIVLSRRTISLYVWLV